MVAAELDLRSDVTLAADFVVPQNHSAYSAKDHEVWRTLYARQKDLLRGRAVDEFFDGLETLGVGAEGIPDFRDLNRTLLAATGWSVVAVPGLVPDDVFFTHLAERRFPAGYWIRSPDQLDYIEEPDVFHDIFGHAPLLMLPRYARYMEAYGKAGREAAGTGRLRRLARLYWYTIEFGLMRTPAGLRIFGAGLASSGGEEAYCLDSPAPNRILFDCERAMRTTYEIDAFQKTYFVLEGWNALPRLDSEELRARFQRVERLPDLASSETLASDILVGRYGALKERR